MTKSPFYVIEDFISPLNCEILVDNCNFFVPDKDKDGYNVKTSRTNEESEAIVYERLRNQIIPIIQEYYDCKYKGTESIVFEWYPTGSSSAPVSGNSTNIKGKWVRNNTILSILKYYLL